MNSFHIDMSLPVVRWAVQSLVATGVLSALAYGVCRVAKSSPLVRLWSTSLALAGCLVLPGLSWLAMQGGVAFVKIPVAVPSVARESEPKVVIEQPASTTDVFVDDMTSTVVDNTSGSIGAASGPVELTRTPTVTKTPYPPVDWRILLIALYGVGFAFSGVRLLLGTARLALVLKSSGEPAPSFLARLKMSGLEPDRPRPFFKIRTSDRVTSPLVAGVLRPSLIFPESFDTRLTADEMRQVLAHEEVHAKGRHALFGLLYRTATIVHWFNPFVHLLANDLTRTLEELCDNAALEHGSASSFARLLVRLAEGQGRQQLEGLALGVLDDRISLERRVRGLLDPYRRTTKTMKPHTRFAVVGTSILATLLMAGTQIVAAQSAWDDLSPTVRSSPGPTSDIVQAGPRLTRAQQRKADRLARRAQKAAGRSVRVTSPQIAVAGTPRVRTTVAGEPIRIAEPGQDIRPTVVTVDPSGQVRRARSGRTIDVIPGTAVAEPVLIPRRPGQPAEVTVTDGNGRLARRRGGRTNDVTPEVTLSEPVVIRRGQAVKAGQIVIDPIRNTARTTTIEVPHESRTVAASGETIVLPQQNVGAGRNRVLRAAPAQAGTTVVGNAPEAGSWSRVVPVTVTQEPGKGGRNETRTVRTGQQGGRATEALPGNGVWQSGKASSNLPDAKAFPRTGAWATGGSGNATPGAVRIGQSSGNLPTGAAAPTTGAWQSVPSSATAPAAPGFQRTGTARAGQIGGSRNGVAPSAQAGPMKAGQPAGTVIYQLAAPAASTSRYVTTGSATSGTIHYYNQSTQNHRPVTVIKGATVVIYDDGTTVITKSGKVTTVHASKPKTPTYKVVRSGKISVPKKPALRKTAK